MYNRYNSNQKEIVMPLLQYIEGLGSTANGGVAMVEQAVVLNTGFFYNDYYNDYFITTIILRRANFLR